MQYVAVLSACTVYNKRREDNLSVFVCDNNVYNVSVDMACCVRFVCRLLHTSTLKECSGNVMCKAEAQIDAAFTRRTFLSQFNSEPTEVK